MLRCVALRCGALRCVALRCVALHCVALRCAALRCVAVRYDTVRYRTAPYLYGTAMGLPRHWHGHDATDGNGDVPESNPGDEGDNGAMALLAMKAK